MQALFEAIREEASAANWSRGVELARDGSVAGESDDGGEITLRVTTRGGLVAPTVTLYCDDLAWECSCSQPDDPCEHVTGAVIALRQSRKQGDALPRMAQSMGHVRYEFARVTGGLALGRSIVVDDQAEPLPGSLRALASQSVKGPRFSATPADLEVDKLIVRRDGPLPNGLVPRVLAALEGCAHLRLDGEPIRVSREPVRPRVVLRDAPQGFELKLQPDDSFDESFPNAIARCGDTLRPVGASGLDGRELEALPGGKLYSFDQAPMLVTEVLPSLRERIEVEVLTRRLPDSSNERPRLLLETERRGDQLSALATLVYGSPPAARIDGGKLVPLRGALPIRDEAAESRLRTQLRNELGLTPGHRVTLGGSDAIALAAKLADWGGEVKGDAQQGFHQLGVLEPKLAIGDDGSFDVSFALDPSESEGAATPPQGTAGQASAGAVLRAWRTGESLVSLTGGGFASLPHDWLTRFGDRIADLLQARGKNERLPACALPDLAILCDDLDHPAPAVLEGLRPLLDDFEGIPSAVLPGDLRASLRDYQRHGIDWLCFLREAGLGALLADDMGLGKTLQALCAIPRRTLVVAPTSVLHGWADEMQRFRPGLSHCLYHGPNRRLDLDADVVLTSYALLRIDAEPLQAVEWRCVVLDEAQNIKNPDSKVAKAAYGLLASWRIALSGTPVENRLEELWSQLHFLNPGLLGGRSDFRNRYARPIADGDRAAGARLRTRIRPFVLRRMKREVARELPARSEVVLRCELSEAEREVYDSIRAASVPEVVKQLRSGGGVMKALETLLRLRQAACHTGLIPGQQATRSSKLDLLLERLEQAFEDGHKALVFSQWTALLDRIEPLLREAGIAFCRLDGSTRDRAGVVGGFQREDGPPVMLVSLKAGGTGLNLTAADHVFLLDPWWNPAVEDQAADRAHRIGQQRPVVIHRVVASDTVEERILSLQKRKRALAEAALGAADHAEKLGRDDLLALLE